MNRILPQHILNIPRLLIVASFLLSTLAGNGSSDLPYYISHPRDFPEAVVSDLQFLLEKATGAKWVDAGDRQIKNGLILKINNDSQFKTGESSIVNADGNGLLSISAPTNNGLIFGIYRHLRDQGFKFYLPDDLYTVIPSPANIFKKGNKTITPALRIRDFFGTGGFGSGATDPDKSVQKAWTLWKWRNGFGAEFPLAGHMGESFNLANAEILEKNPSWTATPIRKNGKVNQGAKLNYFNPQALDFFTDWVLRKYTAGNYDPPATYIRDMVSIEPADGGDFMPGTGKVKGTTLKTVSDQVFYAANLAAEKLDKLFPNHPNIGVNLYAYSQHADVPSFPLHPRVFVQIIPYQFQNIAFGPAFIKRWSEKAKRFGLYDYFKYPDSHWDLPAGYSLDELMKRAIQAAKAGSEGTTYETSYSKFSTGVPLWILSRYMADGNAKWEQEYEQLISTLYGESSTLIKKIFDQFYRQAQFSPGHLRTAFDILQEAYRKTKNSAIRKRLDDLKLYLVYVHAYQQSQNLQAGNLEERLMPVYKLAWTLYESKIVHSYRIMSLLSYAFLNTPGPDAATTQRYREIHQQSFPETTDPNAYWKKPFSKYSYSNQELATHYNSIGKSTRSEKLSEGTQHNSQSALNSYRKNFNSTKKFSIQVGSSNRGYFTLFAEKPTTVTIDYTLTGNNANRKLSISGTNDDYTQVYDKVLQEKSGSYSFTIPAGSSNFFLHAAPQTTYRLVITLNGALVYFSPAPRGPMAFLDKKGNFTYQPPFYPVYFYVPPGTTEVKYKVQVNALSIFSPGGERVASTLIESQASGFEIRSFKVKPADQGKFWKGIVGGNFNYQLLSIPDYWYMIEPK